MSIWILVVDGRGDGFDVGLDFNFNVGSVLSCFLGFVFFYVVE